eukprot:2275153-Alexandrium_andersonii.AAC.1
MDVGALRRAPHAAQCAPRSRQDAWLKAAGNMGADAISMLRSMQMVVGRCGHICSSAKMAMTSSA